MPVKIANTLEQLVALRPVWDELFVSNSNHTPYQSWHWNMAWWRQFGTAGTLRVLVVERAGLTLGIAPLFRRRNFRFIPMAHLCFIGHKRTDYLDFVVRSGCEQSFFSELFEYLCADRSDWTFIELRDVRDRSSSVLPLVQGAARNLPIMGFETFEICVTVPLANSWEIFLAGLSSRTRRHIGYDRRAVSKAYRVQMKLFCTQDALDEGYRDLLEVYRRRWQPQRGATHFDDVRMAAFERQVAEGFIETGCYRLYILYLDGTPVAAVLGYLRDRTIYVDFVVHSPQYAKYSVGNVLLGMAIEDCIRRGVDVFDLTRGDERYKFHWGGQATRNLNLRLYRSRAHAVGVTLVEWLYQVAAGIKPLQTLRLRLRQLVRKRAIGATAPAADA